MELNNELNQKHNYKSVRDLPMDFKPIEKDLVTYKTNPKSGEISEKVASPFIVATEIRKFTSLGFARYFDEADLFFAYHTKEGLYVLINSRGLDVLILRFAMRHGVADHMPGSYRSMVIKDLKGLACTNPTPIEDPYIIMGNGAYEIASRKLVPWSHKIFCLSKIPCNFDPKANCPQFLAFLDVAFQGDPNKIQFIRAYLWAILNGYTQAQIFLFLLGQGGTGKSTLTNILKSTLGGDMVLTTTLRDLHNDKFEAGNVLGKRLILISDTECYQGDLSVLKSLTGGDTLVGRRKHKDGSFEVSPKALVIITGNQPLGAKDSGGALSRRIRVLPMTIKPEVTLNLINYDGGVLTGDLVHELPGIINWGLGEDPTTCKDFLHNTLKRVPSMREQHLLTEGELSPILAWTREVTDVGSCLGAYVGFVNTNHSFDKIILEGTRRGTLYTAYLVYMKQKGLHPVNQIRFVRELMDIGLTHSMGLEKVRRREGIYIKGICVKPEFYERDSLLGSPLLTLVTSINQTITQESKTIQLVDGTPITNKLTIREDLYPQYYAALGRTDFKAEINRAAREIAEGLSAEDFASNYLKALGPLKSRNEHGLLVPAPTQEFEERLTLLYSKSITQVKKFGVVPYKFRGMGLSPRIIPQSYGSSLNSVRKDVRVHILKSLAPFFAAHGLVLLDVDLKSCYTSILLGLYPQELRSIQLAVEGKGLWKHIEEEFKARGQGNLYNKAAVKICTYSSFFMGGNKAMINGILEYFRSQLGMTPQEFRQFPSQPALYEVAKGVAEVMQDSEVIQDFREISKQVLNTFKGESLVGPTGHSYKVEEETFKSAYPNYLQSYEFALLAEGTLRFLETHEGALLIGHFHDGNLLLVRADSVEASVTALNRIVRQVGEELKLMYPQSVEAQIF